MSNQEIPAKHRSLIEVTVLLTSQQKDLIRLFTEIMAQDIIQYQVEGFTVGRDEIYCFKEYGEERAKDFLMEFLLAAQRVSPEIPTVDQEEFLFSMAAARVSALGTISVQTSMFSVKAPSLQVASERAAKIVHKNFPDSEGYFGHTYKHTSAVVLQE